MRKLALTGAILLALVLPAAAQTVVVRPPVRVVRVLPPVQRQVIVEVPRPAPVIRETPLIGIRPGCLTIIGFPLICARL